MKFSLKISIVILLLSFTVIPATVRTVNMEQLQQDTQKNNDTLYVVNFWATWCVPCVNEIPYFQDAYKKYMPKKVKMVFVSLNSAKELSTVEKFVQDKNLKPEVLLLSAGNPNVWINQVDSSWSGAIPATVLYRHGKKLYFHEGDFTADKLNTLIESKLK
jgi:thiol-disulfide isomerase/thioredoxin